MVTRLIVLLAILGGMTPGWSHSQAQQSREKCFTETTGHCVTDEFYDYYFSVEDPLLLFGYPITEPIIDPLSGMQVQYFQRARFELQNDAAPGKRVRLGPLGVDNRQDGEKANFPIDPSVCKQFSNGYHVCYAFMNFYLAHGGEAQFGQPLGDAMYLGKRLVQNFEYARLEWHPELPPGKTITLADLGVIDFNRRRLDPAYLDPPDSKDLGSMGMDTPIILQTRAFVSKPVVKPDSEQTLFVVVQDQNFNPISQAVVVVTVVTASGDQKAYNLPLTDTDGITRYTLKTVGTYNQVITLNIEATAHGEKAQTSTWYRLWW